jgi:FkbH-like protein
MVRAHASATVLVGNFAPPSMLPLGPFDAGQVGGLTHELARANANLAARIASHPGTLVWDYSGLVQHAGSGRWTDRRLWALGRIAVASENQPLLATHLTRTLAGVVRKPAKCLVLDLDNTVWGGVIGDDGLAGIQLGDDYPGSVFKSFQRSILALADRGILLAVVSKNDHQVAEQAFREHPEMLIRWEHISAARINWAPKSGNLRAIAEELNIGSDALVFFDDNPVERAEVRANAPEVCVIEAPTDPLGYERALYDSGVFDQTGVSEEDLARTGMYRQDKERQALAGRHENVGDFLKSLEMEAEIGTADELTLGRIAQLVGKTNQFNLTTRRHGQADLAARAADPGQLVAWLRLRDRFGDQGLVCVAVALVEGGAARLDTFLMSCRVMNRKVEHTLMAYIANWAKGKGCTRLVGEYFPTPKNGMVSEFYPCLGFAPAGTVDGGGQRYTFDLTSATIDWPEVISVHAAPAPA